MTPQLEHMPSWEVDQEHRGNLDLLAFSHHCEGDGTKVLGVKLAPVAPPSDDIGSHLTAVELGGEHLGVLPAARLLNAFLKTGRVRTPTLIVSRDNSK